MLVGRFVEVLRAGVLLWTFRRAISAICSRVPGAVPDTETLEAEKSTVLVVTAWKWRAADLLDVLRADGPFDDVVERDVASDRALDALLGEGKIGRDERELWLRLAEYGVTPLRIVAAQRALRVLPRRKALRGEDSEPTTEERIRAVVEATGWTERVARTVLVSGLL